MALELTANQPVVCVPSTIGDDLMPYDWFLNLVYWSYSPNVDFSLNAYGGVQFFGEPFEDEYFAFSIQLTDAVGIATDCPFVLVSILIGDSSTYITAGNTATVPGSIGADGNEYVIDALGWHTFLYPGGSINTMEIDFGAFEGVVQILNFTVHCPALEVDCDCEFGNYCSPVLFSCDADDSTVASLMAALRLEWIADGSTYEDPACVGEFLEGLAGQESTTCLIQSEEIVIQYPANYTSNQVLNGTFASGANWTLLGKMSIGSGTLNTTPGIGIGSARQDCLTAGQWYKLTFTISAWSAGEVKVYMGATNLVATVGANQTFTIEAQADDVQLIFSTTDSNTFNGKIDNVIALEALPATITAITDEGDTIAGVTELTRLENDTFFQRFKLQQPVDIAAFTKTCFRLYLYTATDISGADTYAPDLCISQPMCATYDPCHSLLIYAQMDNEGEAYGLQFPDPTFGGIFAPRIRVNGQLKNPNYPAEKVTYQDSSGTINTVYAEVRVVKSMIVNLVPKYVHDFLMIATNTDVFRIVEGDSVTDGVYFNRSETYAPNWIRTLKIAPATIEVELKTQNLEKNLCS